MTSWDRVELIGTAPSSRVTWGDWQQRVALLSHAKAPQPNVIFEFYVRVITMIIALFNVNFEILTRCFCSLQK